MLIGVNEANGNDLLVTARLTSDTEKQASDSTPPPTRAVRWGGGVGGRMQHERTLIRRSGCSGVLLTYAICVSECNSCTSQIWTECRRKTFPVIPFTATGGDRGPLPPVFLC